MNAQAPRFGLLAGLIVAAVFVAGIVTGVALDRWWPRAQAETPADPSIASGDLFEGVELTAEQRNRIDALFAETRPHTDAIMNESIGRVRILLDSLEGDIREVLTDEQAAMFEDALRDKRTIRIRRGIMVGDSIIGIDTTLTEIRGDATQ